MNKLEEKLIELGYKPYECFMLVHSFIKIYDDKWNLIIETGCDETNVIECYVDLDGCAIYTQQDIDNLQLAFNEMQKDLEVLKNVKD